MAVINVLFYAEMQFLKTESENERLFRYEVLSYLREWKCEWSRYGGFSE